MDVPGSSFGGAVSTRWRAWWMSGSCRRCGGKLKCTGPITGSLSRNGAFTICSGKKTNGTWQRDWIRAGSGKIDQRSDPVQFACLFMPHFAAALTGRGGDQGGSRGLLPRPGFFLYGRRLRPGAGDRRNGKPGPRPVPAAAAGTGRAPLGFRTKTRVLVADTAMLKQRPPTAKGVMFITLEDETGYIQVVIFPQVR